MSEYNLNEIDNFVKTELFTPIRIDDAHQLHFSTVDSVRQYTKGPGNLPVHVMMNRMLEAMFGHYSTCENVDHKGLSTMFGKLFIGWCQKLEIKNRVLGEPQDGYDYDHHIHERHIEFDQHHKLGNDDVKKIVQEQRLAFGADHRTYSDIVRLISKYFFRVVSQYYIIPRERSKKIQMAYMKLRFEIIEEWVLKAGIRVLRELNPEDNFRSVDPKTVAMDYFPQDKALFIENLNFRLDKYKKWHKKESKEAIKMASTLNDPQYRLQIVNEWDSALLYAKSLHDGMVEMERDREQDDNDFVVETDEDDGEEISRQNNDMDNDEMDMEVDNDIKKYNGKELYKDDATEEEIDEFLRRHDKKSRRHERKFRDEVETDD